MRFQVDERAASGAGSGCRRPRAGALRRPGRHATILAGMLGVGLAAAPFAAAADFQRTFVFQSSEFVITDFIGAVHVEPATGNEVRVVVDVRGKDADPKRIDFEEQQGSTGRLTVRFPVKESHRYVYPDLGEGRSSFSLGDRDDKRDWFSELIASAVTDRIEVRGRPWRDALELWADVTVQVPARTKTTVQLGLGRIEAKDLQSDLNLKVHSGPVRAAGVKGALKIDTGSGSVEVRGARGDLHVDTGSGEVDIGDVSEAKRVELDTGSGSVQAAQINADALIVDTGSGGVDLEDVQVRELSVDTGSGGVQGLRVGAESAKIDTGSGGVRLDLVRMGRGVYELDTGSGGIRMRVPSEISATFAIDTGSGDIDTDLEGVTLSKLAHGKARFKVGNGDATVNLSTGSGSVQVMKRSDSATER